MSDNSRVRVSIVGVVVVALFSTLLARLWFLQSGPERQLEGAGRRRQHARDPDARARAARSSTATARCSCATAVVGGHHRPRPRRRRSRDKVHRPARRAARRQGRDSSSRSTRATASRRSSPRSSRSTCRNRIGSRSSRTRRTIPGVHVKALTVREYPQGDLARAGARLRRRGPERGAASSSRSDGYEPGDQIGRAGVEAAFESVLRGRPRRETIEVDPTGRQVGAPVEGRAGRGRRQRVPHDRLERADARPRRRSRKASLGARTLQNTRRQDQGYETFKAPAGAVVVLDASDGSVAALASYPDVSTRRGGSAGSARPNYDAI